MDEKIIELNKLKVELINSAKRNYEELYIKWINKIDI